MASFFYNNAKHQLALGALNFATADLRVILVMAGTTADTEDDAVFVSSLTALDEMDGAAYVRKAYVNQALAKDQPNNRSEFDADDITWAALGAGTTDVIGAVIYLHVTNDADSPLIAYIDDGGFPFTATGIDITIQWNAEGIINFT